MWNGMLKFRAKFASKNLLIKMIISYVLTGAILLLLTQSYKMTDTFWMSDFDYMYQEYINDKLPARAMFSAAFDDTEYGEISQKPTPDTPLIQCGVLTYGPRLIMGHEALQNRSPQLYVWALNNFGETNFKATVGGVGVGVNRSLPSHQSCPNRMKRQLSRTTFPLDPSTPAKRFQSAYQSATVCMTIDCSACLQPLQ